MQKTCCNCFQWEDSEISATDGPSRILRESNTVEDIKIGTGHHLWTVISGGWNALPLLHKVTLNHLKGGKNQAILHCSLFLLVLKTLIKMAPGATLLPKTSNSTVFIYMGEFLMKMPFFFSAQPIL